MMDLMEAMKFRHAVREYSNTPIDKEKIEDLNKIIDECNKESGLNIQLITEEPEAFKGMRSRYGEFVNVNNYFALVGKDDQDLERKLGYYGEKIVLRAVQLGLGTCWTAVAFANRKGDVKVGPDEKFVCVIAVGNYTNAGVPHDSKSLKDIGYKSKMPDWFKNGAEAALLAPTAMNQQKFHFTLDDNKVSIKTERGFFAKVDLGIIKYHFEIGAGDGDWEWSDK